MCSNVNTRFNGRDLSTLPGTAGRKKEGEKMMDGGIPVGFVVLFWIACYSFVSGAFGAIFYRIINGSDDDELGLTITLAIFWPISLPITIGVMSTRWIMEKLGI